MCARASHVNVIQFTKTNVTGTQVRYGKVREEKKSDEHKKESEKKRKMLSKGFVVPVV